MRSFKVKRLVEVSMLVAIAFVLDYMSNLFMGWFWPSGGSVSIALVPIAIIAFRYGFIVGVTSGFIMGLLQLLTGAYILHPIQVLFDYPLPYAALGFAGIFKVVLNRTKSLKQGIYIWLATGVASILRLIFHVISGAIFFAPMTEENPWIFSLIYNAPYVIASYIVSAFILMILYQKHAKYLM